VRRLARAQAEVRVFRDEDAEARADADAAYWLRIPVERRAEFAWQLSLEAFALAHPTVSYEPGLSRSVVRIHRG